VFCNRALSSSAMRKHRLLVIVAIALIDTGCTSVFGATKDFVGEPFKAADLPRMNGQIATSNGPREKTFTLEGGRNNRGSWTGHQVRVETVTDGASVMRDVQTYGVPAGSGAIVEFRIPEPGMYGLVDHDRLAYLPYGMVIPFVTPGHGENGTK
jgi:hypothetical protein